MELGTLVTHPVTSCQLLCPESYALEATGHWDSSAQAPSELPCPTQPAPAWPPLGFCPCPGLRSSAALSWAVQTLRHLGVTFCPPPQRGLRAVQGLKGTPGRTPLLAFRQCRHPDTAAAPRTASPGSARVRAPQVPRTAAAARWQRRSGAGGPGCSAGWCGRSFARAWGR